MADPSSARQAFVAQAHKRSLPPKHTMLHAGDVPPALCLILEGSVSLLLEDSAGREMVLGYLSPGEFFGEACLFAEQQQRTTVRTRGPTLVAEMGPAAFRAFIRQEPDFMLVVAGQLALRLGEVSQRVAHLTFLDVAGRMAQTLATLGRKPDAVPHPSGVVVRISRMELARHIGCSREMAGRALKKLRNDGLVRDQGRSILLLGSGGTLAVQHAA